MGTWPVAFLGAHDLNEMKVRLAKELWKSHWVPACIFQCQNTPASCSKTLFPACSERDSSLSWWQKQLLWAQNSWGVICLIQHEKPAAQLPALELPALLGSLERKRHFKGRNPLTSLSQSVTRTLQVFAAPEKSPRASIHLFWLRKVHEFGQRLGGEHEHPKRHLKIIFVSVVRDWFCEHKRTWFFRYVHGCKGARRYLVQFPHSCAHMVPVKWEGAGCVPHVPSFTSQRNPPAFQSH